MVVNIMLETKRLLVGVFSSRHPSPVKTVGKIPSVSFMEWIKGGESFGRNPRSQDDVFEDVFDDSRPIRKS